MMPLRFVPRGFRGRCVRLAASASAGPHGCVGEMSGTGTAESQTLSQVAGGVAPGVAPFRSRGSGTESGVSSSRVAGTGSQLLILPVPGGPVLGPDCPAPGLPVLGQWQLVGLVGGFPESRYRHRPRVGCHGRGRVVGHPLGLKGRSHVESHCHVGSGYW